MSESEKTKKKFTKAEIKVLMKNFDKEMYDNVLEKEFIKQLGSALMSQHRKFNLRELIMLICGALGGFGIATIIFGFATGLFGGAV